MPDRESLLDRFCRYVRIDTQSSATSTTYPSTDKQKDLLGALVDDLKAAGLADAEMDEFGYVLATLPANIPPGHPAFGKVPTIGLLGHVDTYHEVSGTDVKPQVHRNYDGGDIVLPGDPSIVIRAADEPALAACKGMTIITADGTTLLGADDKAGVAEILEALWRLHDDPARVHGPIRVAFTPDEEVGRGTEHFDVKRFGATLCLHGRRLGRRRARERDVLRRHGVSHGDRRRRPPGLCEGQDGQRPARRLRHRHGAAAAPDAGNDRRARGLPAPDQRDGQRVGGQGAVPRPRLRRGRPAANSRRRCGRRSRGSSTSTRVRRRWWTSRSRTAT